MKNKMNINWPTLVLAAAFIVFAGYQAMAVRAIRQMQPAIIATVDLHRVMTQTQERSMLDAEVRKIVSDFEKQGKDMMTQLREKEEELELLAEGSEKYQQMLEALAMETNEYAGFTEWARRRIEAESAMRLRRLYTSVKSNIAAEAAEKGYDIVFVNDALGELRAGDEAEVTMQISARRMLYSSPRLDITADVIARMDAAN